MIIIKRQDGYTLNISVCRSTSQTRQGLVVEMGPDEYFLIPGYDIDQFADDSRLRVESPGSYQDLVKIINREWRGWPQ